MTEYTKVKGCDLIRDMSNMSLINTDKTELEAYLSKRKVLREQKQEINTIKQQVSDIQKDVSQIKELLLQLTNR